MHQEDEEAPAVPLEAMVAREIDVVDFTSVPSVPEEHRGKLLGVIGKLATLTMALLHAIHNAACQPAFAANRCLPFRPCSGLRD